jgi:hypothetical protein
MDCNLEIWCSAGGERAGGSSTIIARLGGEALRFDRADPDAKCLAFTGGDILIFCWVPRVILHIPKRSLDPSGYNRCLLDDNSV